VSISASRCLVTSGGFACQVAHVRICLQAARETGALQAAKSKLEKQVEELTWRLQLAQKISEQKVAEVHKLQSELKDAKDNAEQVQAVLAREREEHKVELSRANSSSVEVATAGVSAKASAELMAKYEKLVSQNGQLMVRTASMELC
jgi:myosin-5